MDVVTFSCGFEIPCTRMTPLRNSLRKLHVRIQSFYYKSYNYRLELIDFRETLNCYGFVWFLYLKCVNLTRLRTAFSAVGTGGEANHSRMVLYRLSFIYCIEDDVTTINIRVTLGFYLIQYR
jgi:hypothetical protein